MSFNPANQQWVCIVQEFEGMVKAQKNLMAEKNSHGFEVDEYEDGWLRALELGLTQAKGCRRTARFSFWSKPTAAKEMLLVGFLLLLREQIGNSLPGDTSYRSGMMDAIDHWVDYAVNHDLIKR